MTLTLRNAPMLLLCLATSAAVTVACGDDKGSGDEHNGTEPQVCMDISSACHDLDTGSGMAHDCHEQAHEGDAAVCEMIRDECLAACGGGSETTAAMTTSTTTDAETTDHGTTDHGTTDHGTAEDTTHGHDTSSGDTSSGGHHDTGTGTDTGANSCDLIGSGCHDNATPEGIACHDLGHDGDVAACDEAFAMCAKICGL